MLKLYSPMVKRIVAARKKIKWQKNVTTRAKRWWIHWRRWRVWSPLSIAFHLLNIFISKFFEHRFHAPFAYIVSDDTHFGIGNSPFGAVKMAWPMKRTTSKLWPFLIFLSSNENEIFVRFLLLKNRHANWTLAFVIFPSRHNKIYGKMNAFTYETTLLGHEHKAAVTLIRFK